MVENNNERFTLLLKLQTQLFLPALAIERAGNAARVEQCHTPALVNETGRFTGMYCVFQSMFPFASSHSFGTVYLGVS